MVPENISYPPKNKNKIPIVVEHNRRELFHLCLARYKYNDKRKSFIVSLYGLLAAADDELLRSGHHGYFDVRQPQQQQQQQKLKL